MRREPGVMDRLDAWVAVQERGDPQRVVRMGAHPVRQRADTAANEPAVERRRHGAARGLDRADTLEDRVASPGHDGTAEHVAVAAQVLRRRVQHEVGAELEGRLEHRRGRGVVAHVERAGAPGDLADRRDVGHFPQRVRRRLHPDEPRVRPDGRPRGRRVGHVDERGVELPPGERLAQEARGPVIGVHRRDEVVPRLEREQDRGGGGRR